MMARNNPAETTRDLAELRLRSASDPARDPRSSGAPRTIVIRHGSPWQTFGFFALALLLAGAVLLGHWALSGIDRQSQQVAASVTQFERRVQHLESRVPFDAKRRYLLLGMRDHILKVNPRVGLGEAYLFAQLAIEATERYPAVDPLLLLAVGTVESGYDPQARSRSDARGLYQIWPSTGRLLFRSLGWDYEDAALYDPAKNTLAAALYLDILFATYRDPQLVLAEYNGGPLNAGYFRAGFRALAEETRDYVPRVLELHGRLKERFDKGMEPQLDLMHRDSQREGKTLGGAPPTPRR
jgi:hypothetical protein